MGPNEVIEVVQVRFSWVDRAILVIASSLVATIFAYVSNKIYRNEVVKTEMIQGVSKEFLHQLNVVDSLIKDYWSVAGENMKNGKETRLSSSIIVAFPHLHGIINLLFRLKNKNNLEQKMDFQKNIAEIYEYVTTNIDVTPREASRETVMKSSKAILSLKLKFKEFIYK